MIEPELDGFLDDLEHALRSLRRGERRRALREARDHVLCAAAEGESAGRRRDDALRHAIESFGPADAIAASYARGGGSRNGATAASGVVVGALVLAALTILPIGGGLGKVFISESHAAESGCAGSWNQHPPSALYRLAWVASPGRSCTVTLHDGQRAVVFEQAAGGAGWYVVHPAGKPAWSVSTLPLRYRARPYRLVDDGQLEQAASSSR